MEPLDYCRLKAAPPGSSLHYALLFAPRDARAGLLAVSALHAEISTIVDDCSETGVAAAKLNWWREELERIRAGEPRHPVGVATTDTLTRHGLDGALLDELITGARMDLEYGTYPTFRELTVHCHRLGVTPAQLGVQICGYDRPETLSMAHDLGMGLHLTRLLRRLPAHLRQGRVYLPEEDLQRAGIDRQTLLSPGPAVDLVPLFRQQAERARSFLENAGTRVAASDRRRVQPLLVMADLYRHLIDVIERDGFPLLERRHHLTPLKKLSLAWRTARRQRQLAKTRENI